MRKTASLMLLMFFCTLAFGQSRTITGQVKDDKGEPIAFATVVETGTQNATKADATGNFSLKVKEGAKLTISSTGFDPITVTPGTGFFAYTLKTRAAELQEVVVTTALGIQRQAKEIGYATAKVKGTELTQARAINLQNGLTGKVSGLNIQTVNNGVFGDTRITLRGIRSLTGNNQPMLILDGVPIALGYISSINPNDIADVTILKSASATAVYGPDGVNGAIVVTLKKGSKSRPSVSLGHTVQIEKVSFMPKLQSQFGSGSSVDAFGYGVYDPIENQCYGDQFDGTMRQIGRDGPTGEKYMVPYSPLINEKKKFWNTGVTNQTDFSISTGDFYFSAQNVLIQGIMPKDQNRRVALHMSANKEYGKLKASYSLNYTKGNYDITTGSSFGNGRDYTVYWNLLNTPMEIPLTRFKNWQKDYWASPDGYYNDYYSNPYWAIDNFRGIGRSNDFFGNVELNYKVTNWLTAMYRLGTTVSDASSKFSAGALTYGQFAKASGKSIAQSGDLAAQVADGSSTSSRVNSEFYLTARKSFSEFNIEALVGQNFRQTDQKSISVSSNNLAFPTLFNIIGRKGEPGASEGNSKTRLERFFGKVSLGYNNWVFGEVTGSYDINSILSNHYNFNMKDISYFYPGGSLSVVLSEAIPAIKASKFISYLKLRGSISKTGNANLAAQGLENTYGLGGGFPYGTLVGYTSSNVVRQASYKPEFVVSKDAGFEISFLKNRISLEATAYTQDNTNQIVQVQYSGATGFTSALLNAAAFTNKGLEFDLKLTPLIKIRDVSIDFKANYTYQTNKVTKIIQGVDQLGIGNANYVLVGSPAYTFKLTDYIRDDQGRVVVDPVTGLPSVDPTIKPFGHTQPTNIVGLSLNVNWKGLSFAVVADYRGGNQIYTGNLGTGMDFSGISARSGQNSRQPFIFPNSSYFDGTKYVANNSIYMQSGGYNFWSQSVNTAANTNYLVDGSFWKIREASISYTIPSKWLGFTHNAIKGVNVALTGRNLFMFLPKTNEWTDPEFSNTTGNAQGVSGLDNTPPTRIIGFSVTFQL